MPPLKCIGIYYDKKNQIPLQYDVFLDGQLI